MIGAARARLTADGGQSGFTLVELLVAATLSVILVGAAGSMVISAVRGQPRISERSQNVSQARWVLERLTREIRNGVSVAPGASGSRVSFVSNVRRPTCGAGGTLASDLPARPCQITYDCSSPAGADRQGRPRFACTRTEAEPGDLVGGATTTIVSGLGSADVFSFSPSAAAPGYIGITLRIPNSDGPAGLAISDGASLRTLTLNSG